MDQSSSRFKCKDCDFVFKKKWNLLRHVATRHQKGKNLNNLPQFICFHCNKNSSTKYGLIKHLSKCQIRESRNTSKLIKCPMCNYQTDLKESMLKHYHQEHEIDVTVEILKFDSLFEFEQWKQNFEKQNICKYKKKKCNKSRTTITQYYRCHRDGFFNSRGKNLRHIKINGSNKIDGYCPSKIDVSVNNANGEVTAKILKSHVGHEMDLGRIPLSTAERTSIAQKISQKIPFDEVLNNIRDNVGYTENLERIHLLNRKDLYNIEQLFNLKNDAVRHPNDCVSVDAWVKYTRKDRFDSIVRFYKAQGEIDQTFSELKENDFLLIIMNDAQLDVLKKYGNDCICVDGTHGLNAYGFELNTVMVLDDLRQGFPCLFAFSNRSDTEVFKIIFHIMQNCVGYSLKPQVFMSDMAEAFYNGWTLVMGPVQNRLYCTWHVLRAWDKNVKEKIKDKERQSSTFDALRTLLEELDANAFDKMLNKFIENLMKDPEMQDFYRYYVTDTRYVENRKCWAYCYRKHMGLNTNMHLERMHQTLKYIYLKGRKVKRLDKAINAIMKMVRDKLFDRLIILNKGKLTTKLSNLRRRHKNIKSLENSIILQENKNQWIVSSSEGTEMYIIEKTDTTCSCDLKCVECKACIHAYYCTCPDSSIKWNMCKHIHFLVQNFQFDDQNQLCNTTTNMNLNTGIIQKCAPNYDCDNNLNDSENNLVIVENIRKAESAEVFNHITSSLRTTYNKETNLEKFKARILDNVQSILSKAQTIEDCQIVENALKPVSAAIAANQEANSKETPRFVTTVNSITNKRKIEPQRKFVSTKKKTKRKRCPWSLTSKEVKNTIASNLILCDNNYNSDVA